MRLCLCVVVLLLLACLASACLLVENWPGWCVCRLGLGWAGGLGWAF